MNWYAQHRQDWIAESLRVFGFINRVHLVRKFGISIPQAAVDLRTFRNANPDAMTYDPHSKRYVAAASGESR